jgi:WD40 repeat protein
MTMVKFAYTAVVTVMLGIHSPALGEGATAPSGTTPTTTEQISPDVAPRLEISRKLRHGTTNPILRGWVNYVTGVAWSPDGRLLASYSDYGSLITIWSADGSRLKEFRRCCTYLHNSILFLSGGRRILTPAALKSRADNRFAFTLWDVDTGTVDRNIIGLSPEENWQYNRSDAFALSPDGQSIAALTRLSPAPVTLYSTRDWSIVRKIEVTDPKYVDAPYSLAFSPDGGLLAIGVSSGKVFIFDLKQPEAVPSTLHVNRDLVGVGIGRHVGWLLARRGLASGRSRRRRHGLHINALTRFHALELDAFDEATTLLWVWRFLASTAVS